MSMSVFSTIVTHAACMGVVFTFVLGRHFIPYFGLARFGIAALAIFESGWLFVKPTIKKQIPDPTPVVTSTADDYQEWLAHSCPAKIIACGSWSFPESGL